MINQNEKSKIKLGIILSTYAILLTFCLMRFDDVKLFFSSLTALLMPLMLGLAIAFILNIPMKFFESNVFSFLDTKFKGKYKNAKRGLSILSTFVFLILLLIGFMFFMIPQLKESISTLVSSIPDHISSLEDMMNAKFGTTEVTKNIIDSAMNMWKEIIQTVGSLAADFLSQAVTITISITSTIANFILAIVISVYVLASKEKLVKQFKKFLYAFNKKSRVDSLLKILRISNTKFSKFIQGQVTEAVIIGVLVFIGMTIFGFEYAGLISTIIGVTALIPIFGAIIGTIPGILILLTISPMKAVWFLVLIIVIQQLEGNLIYPKVVGGTIGLSGLWVMIATIIGGNMFGIVGILIGIPFVSILYTLVSEVISNKLKEKNIKIK